MAPRVCYPICVYVTIGFAATHTHDKNERIEQLPGGTTMKSQSIVAITVMLEWKEDVYVVTCKELPELLTDGRTIDEALKNVEDALIATLEIYHEMGRELPDGVVKEEQEAITEPQIRTIEPEYEPNVWFRYDSPNNQEQYAL